MKHPISVSIKPAAAQREVFGLATLMAVSFLLKWANHTLTESQECQSRSFRHARDPESLDQSFDIFRPAKWAKVLGSRSALGGVQLHCEHARLSCFFNSSAHRMACHHDTLSGQKIRLLHDNGRRPR